MTNVFDQRVSSDDQEDQTTEAILSDMPVGLASDDANRTPADVRSVVQELLKHGYIEERSRQELFRRTIIVSNQIKSILEPLDFALRLDTHRGIAFLAVTRESTQDTVEDEGWAHPLVRKQRLTLEQSLLVAILRQAFVMHEQERGVGQCAATISIDELLPQCMAYFGDSGSDSKNENRLLQLLDQLKTYGIVSEVDRNHEVIIRPLIAHLADPKSLSALLTVLKDKRQLAMTNENEANDHA